MFPVAVVARAAGEATAPPQLTGGILSCMALTQSSAVVICFGISVPSSVSPPSHTSSRSVPPSAVPAPLPHSGAPTPGTRKQPPPSPHPCSFHRSCLSGLAQCDPSKSPGLACPFPAKAPSLVVVTTGFIVHTLHSAPRAPSSCCHPLAMHSTHA